MERSGPQAGPPSHQAATRGSPEAVSLVRAPAYVFAAVPTTPVCPRAEAQGTYSLLSALLLLLMHLSISHLSLWDVSTCDVPLGIEGKGLWRQTNSLLAVCPGAGNVTSLSFGLIINKTFQGFWEGCVLRVS